MNVRGLSINPPEAMENCKLLRRLKYFVEYPALAVGCVLLLAITTASGQSTPPSSEASGPTFGCSIEPELSRLTCKMQGTGNFADMKYFSLEAPDRLVIDVPQQQVGGAESYSLVDSPVIQRIRSGQRGEVARVVLDLSRKASVSMSQTPDKRVAVFDFVALPSQASSTSSVPAVATAGSLPLPSEEEHMAASIPSNAAAQDKLSIVAPQSPDVSFSIQKKSLEPDHILKFSVDSTFISFEPGERPIRDVMVVNKTDQELFLRTDIQRVENSGLPEEVYESTKTLIATPRRFSLPPLATRAVRVLLAGNAPDAGEDLYRLILSPEQAPASEVEVSAEVNEAAARIKVVAGLGVTITLPSAAAKGVLKIESQVNQVTLVNSGSRAVLVENCSSCPLDRESCSSSGRKLLHPNRPWSIPVSGSGVIHCDVSVGKQAQKLSSFYGTQGTK